MTELDLVHGQGTPFRDDCVTNGGYERQPDCFHLRFDPATEPAAHAVVKAASFVHNVDQAELAPLAHAIDPDALDALIGCSGTDGPSGVEVAFVYEGLEITVADDGNIWLQWQ